MEVEVFVVSKVLWTCGIEDLNVDSMKKSFYKQALQKRTHDVFRVKTFTRRKKIKLFVKWKCTLVMRADANINVKLYLTSFIYATKKM